MPDAVNHPAHYGGDVTHEVYKCLAEWGLTSNVYLWQVVKYIARAGKKDPKTLIQDLEKAAWYLNRAIERHGGEITKEVARQALPAGPCPGPGTSTYQTAEGVTIHAILNGFNAYRIEIESLAVSTIEENGKKSIAGTLVTLHPERLTQHVDIEIRPRLPEYGGEKRVRRLINCELLPHSGGQITFIAERDEGWLPDKEIAPRPAFEKPSPPERH